MSVSGSSRYAAVLAAGLSLHGARWSWRQLRGTRGPTTRSKCSSNTRVVKLVFFATVSASARQCQCQGRLSFIWSSKYTFSQLRDELSRSDSLKVKRADGCRGAIAGEHQRVPRTVGCPRPRVQVTWAGERAAHGRKNYDEKEKKSEPLSSHATRPLSFWGLSIEACSRYAALPGPALTPPVCLCRRRRQVCRRMHLHLRV